MYMAITTNLVFCIATIHNVYFILFHLLSFMMQEDLHQRSKDNLCPQPEIITCTLINYITLQLLNYTHYTVAHSRLMHTNFKIQLVGYWGIF